MPSLQPPLSAPTPSNLSSLLHSLLPLTTLSQPPSTPLYPHLTATIASLSLHPTLEAALHLLNHDLPSAHFLVRHMQAPPAVEGMLLHGILHRAEGDFNNARAWVGDVRDACAGWVPKRREAGERLDGSVIERIKGGKGEGGEEMSLVRCVYGDDGEEEAARLIDDVEVFRGKKGSERREGEGEQLDERIRRELGRVMEWCRRKFGDGEVVDAREAWVKNSEEIARISEDMVSGDKGFRKF